MAHVQISDNDYVLRRVPTHFPDYIKADGTISSLSFYKKRSDIGLSVDLEALTTLKKAALDDKRFRLLRINVGIIRNVVNEGLDVIHDPIPGNDAHSLITGDITESKKKKLLKNSSEISSGLC